MDQDRFDTLTRFPHEARSRRGALVTLLGISSALSLLGWNAVEDAAAHDARKKCKKKSVDKKKKCLEKAKKHNATHTSPTPSLAGSCATGQADVCREGLVPAANCNATAACSCYTTTAGARFCGEDQGDFCPTGGCSTDAECRAAPGAGGTQAACVMWTSVNGGMVCGECIVGSKSFCLRPCLSQP